MAARVVVSTSPGGQSSSGAGGSIIIKPGAGSSSGSTYLQTHAGTNQMTISNSGVTVSATLTAQSTVYASWRVLRGIIEFEGADLEYITWIIHD